ncbi:MAG TPA: hypothetical protein PKY77_16260 [Phycisphaerae bacterium]|nr:hypothetical protein [Phycisphaerae bacterium]
MVGVVGMALVVLGGCRRDLDIPPMEVKVVEAYGVKLDAAASPKRVVYVLLRSLRDDVEASQAWDQAKKKQAFQTSFALAAFQAMSHRLMDTPAILNARKGGEADAVARHVYDAVDHWAPIVGHYIRSFEADEQAATAKMTEVLAPDGRTGRVYVDAAHDSQQEDPAKAQSVTLVVEVAREKGVDGGEYWRVLKLGYQPRTKVITVSAPSRG